MPQASFSEQITIQTDPQTAFDYVSDLTTHGEWGANSLSIAAIEDGEVRVGKEYRSSADVGSLHFDAELIVSELKSPERFTFTGSDKTGKFTHTFTFAPSGNATTVTRTATFDLALSQYLFYLVTLLPVRRPAMRKSLTALKQKLEAKA